MNAIPGSPNFVPTTMLFPLGSTNEEINIEITEITKITENATNLLSAGWDGLTSEPFAPIPGNSPPCLQGYNITFKKNDFSKIQEIVLKLNKNLQNYENLQSYEIEIEPATQNS